MTIVDTCGWIEWLTDGVLASEFEPYLLKPELLVVPTTIQYELHKWICRERSEAMALEIIAYTQQASIVAFTQTLALRTSALSQQYRLSFADAIIYATAEQENAGLVTADDHFENLPNVRFFSKKQTAI
ncbi:type II toxin-antitoxin system VapC family toxin [Methylovulum miyakonense]|uniref:type II toxin-antitoxin system VapC family toxin n=1 Tax=Methylovulum miyakonense TaxID=645578 RepID=UPI00035D6E7B|nr:type II toxin-antitoxin system VapC family toxin [Methylovulum miyakonense]